VLSIALFRPHPSIGQKKARQLVDLSALCLVSFDVFCFSLFCLYTGLYIPFLYASLYSQTKLHISAALSFDMVTFLNVGAIVGRVVGGYIADRFRSSLLLQTACAAVAGVLTFCWVAISDTAGMVVFCVLYGACQGIIVALPPAIIASMVPDPTKTGTWIGTGMMFSGLGVLLGSPIAGVLVSTDGGGFVGAQAFAGGVIMLGVVALCIFRMV
jgi:MFS family permease